jgi:hypothetical protein
MSLVDVDVIAKPGGIKGGDPKLNAFRKELERQEAYAKVFGVADEKLLIKDTINVYDMVTRIISGIGSRRIRRLRIYGHGSVDSVQVGPFQRTGGTVDDFVGGFRSAEDKKKGRRIEDVDKDKVLMVIELTVKSEEDGRVVGVERHLLNEPALKKLKDKFDPGGWVELHSCKVVGEGGSELIKALANYWLREVHASQNEQTVAGGLGFQGNVWIAKPGQKPFSKPPPQQKPSGAQYDPLQEATRRLQAGRAAISPMLPGTTYSDISTRKTYKVDDFGRHIQTGLLQGLASHGTGPTTQSFQARFNPLQEATRRLQAGQTNMAYKPNPETQRWLQGLATRYGAGSTTQTLQARYDPMKEATRRLQAGQTNMAYKPNPETQRWLQGLATRYGAGSTSQSFQARYDPMKAAVRKLMG